MGLRRWRVVVFGSGALATALTLGVRWDLGLAARLMEEIARACVGETDGRRAIVFDGQYITTGGQFYELMVVHDRFIVDLRPLFYRLKGMPVGMSTWSDS